MLQASFSQEILLNNSKLIWAEQETGQDTKVKKDYENVKYLDWFMAGRWKDGVY